MMPVMSATPNTLQEGYSLQASEKLGTVFASPASEEVDSCLPQPFRVINAAQPKVTAQLVFLFIFFIVY